MAKDETSSYYDALAEELKSEEAQEKKLREAGKNRILWLRSRGLIDWRNPEGKSRKAYAEAKAYNIQQVQNTSDPVLRRLRDRLQELLEDRNMRYAVEQSTTSFVRTWLESYPVEYQRIQNMRFVG